MSQIYYPLSYPQQSIWYLEKTNQKTVFSNIAGTITLFEKINYEYLANAINLLLKENDAMRIRITEKRNRPEQYISKYEIHKLDFLNFTYPDGLQDLDFWEQETTQIPFVLNDMDLFYFALFKMNDNEGGFYLKVHHIISDIWSSTLIIKQVLENYYKILNNLELPSELKPSYLEFLQSEQRYQDKFLVYKEFWSRLFKNFSEPTFIKGKSSGKSTIAKSKTFTLSYDLSTQIKTLCEEYKISIFIFFYSILSIYIRRVTSNNDIVISTPVLNRANAKEKATIGMYTNTIPFRTIIDDTQDFLAYIQTLNKEWRQILKNQRYPYNLILRDLRSKHKNLSRLTDVFLSHQNGKFDVEFIKSKAHWCFNGNEINTLSIHISEREGEGKLILDYVYLTELFTLEEIEQMHSRINFLIQEVLKQPLKEMSELEILSDMEKGNILWDFNATQGNYPYYKSLSQLFEEQVEKNPDNVALIFQEQKLTYKELNNKANSLANLLRSKGVTKDTIVGLMVNRSFDMLIGMLGVLKAGGAYLPLDPGYPEARINYMLRDSNVQILLTQSYLDSTKQFLIEQIYLDDLELYNGNLANPEETSKPNDLAYVIYTSGSTGNPKGVMIEQKAVNNFIHAMNNQFKVSSASTVLSLTTFSFDIFVLETLLPLLEGLRVVIANEDEQKIPQLLFKLIEQHKVDILQTTPTRMQSIIKEINGLHSLKNLSKILIGGESFPDTLLSQLKLITPAEIFNMYGPTETTVWSAIQNVTHSTKITIGKPIANTQIFILDHNLRPVPVGVTGEIYISGDGLARGYLNNDDLTGEIFIANPFIPGTKMYRTGDLGRWLADGSIEYIGRNDAQVKIRGFRIELGEIENCLLKHGHIRQVAVALKEDRSGKKYLSAYLVGDQVSVVELRSYIAKYLPDYMVPTYFTWLDEIPLTPNGKTNRKALPEPDQTVSVEVLNYVAPRNSIEIKLVEVWAKALEIERVGIDDNLFSLGGDSLTVIEILSGVFSNNWAISAQDFYEHPTIRELSAKIRGLVKAESESTDEQAVIVTKDLANTNEIVLSLKQNSLGNVLLTGATGFLGVHILKELMTNISGKIYCLVRGRNPEQRLVKLLEFYFPGELKDLINEKLLIINGDVTKEKLGLSQPIYDLLTKDIATVIHAAANVKHYGNYPDFEIVNVRGTKEIVNFCLAHNKRLHHISTMSVSGNYLISQGEKVRFTEKKLYIGQNYKDNVYVRSKFEAESIIFNARNSGLRANIFRVGVLTGRYTDGQFQSNISDNAFYNKLKSMVKLGVLPAYLLEQQIEFTPVDYCAQGIAKIIRAYEATGNVYHMYNYKMIMLKNILEILESLGFAFKILDGFLFEQYIKNISEAGELEILNGLITDLSLNKDLKYGSNIELDCEQTKKILQELSFNWPDIDREYVNRIFAYMQKIGFLEILPISASIVS